MSFRYLITVLILVFLVESLLVVPEVWGPGKRFLAAVLPALVVDYANTDRVSEQKPPLQINPLLAQAAQLKAEDMANRSYFSHEGPNGEAPWTWFDKVGYKYVYAGENLALNFYESSEVNQAWMNSPKHRENILDKNFTDIGIGLANGRFEGRDSVFIVQFFGSTEDSLAKQEKLPTTRLGFRRTNVLSAAIGLSDGVLTRLRTVSLLTLRSLGYPVVKGKII
ncbi:MAG: CAP domain-containing protein [Candidatus Paceibacterota bacterium]